jgi:hypothetical protein
LPALGSFLLAPPRPDTEAVCGKLAPEPDDAWRPWSIWLPCAPTFACSGALIMAAARQGVLAAVDVGILMAGAKRPRLAHL